MDGEGAKKFITINVINAKSLGSAGVYAEYLPEFKQHMDGLKHRMLDAFS